MIGPFEAGERVLLIDQRDRTYLVHLSTGATFHTHCGTLDHDAVLGAVEGTRLETSRGMVLVAFRPRFADYVLKMPRGAQVVYPKDLGPIVTYADIFPGARVLEAGTRLGRAHDRLVPSRGRCGPGRLLRAPGRASREGGREHRGVLRQDAGRVELRRGDLSGVAGTGERYDRCVLDIPEPWGPLPALREVLVPGGIVCAYLPTTVQVQQFVLSLPGNGFQHIETFETLKRGWHVTERSVRPDHRMVGHTGFLTIARREA